MASGNSHNWNVGFSANVLEWGRVPTDGTSTLQEYRPQVGNIRDGSYRNHRDRPSQLAYHGDFRGDEVETQSSRGRYRSP